ncbi:MAG TPA: VWA domain-containing protein [Phycisphaerales bacterium]|nr:VWA domain-containing protein [Phycisphaerales bacterium]
MSWLTPGLAAIAAAIAIPSLLILYFLKLRRRDVEVSSTLLWKRTVHDMQANAPFQKLRKNLLLFLQLLVLAAGLLALAQPMLSEKQSAGDRNVIMIDRSASMQTEDGQWKGKAVTRLEQAKREALELIDSLAEPTWLDGVFGGADAGADKATVIVFDSRGEIRQPMTADKGLLRLAVESIQPSDAPTSASQAYRLAIAQAPPRAVPDRDGTMINLPPAVGTVHFWSDGRIKDARDVVPGPEDLVVYNEVGERTSANIGLTGLRAERSFRNPRELSIFVGLVNTDTKKRTVDVQFIVNGSLASVRTAEIAPATGPVSGGQDQPGTGGVVFRFERAGRAVVEVRVKPSDGGDDLLAVDNVGWLVVPPSKKLKVALVSPDDFFTSLALEGMNLALLDKLTPEQYEEQTQHGALSYDVVVFDGWVPSGSLPAGNFLVLGAVPEGFGLQVEPGTGSGEIVDWDEESPIMRSIELGGRVTIARVPTVRVGNDASVEVLAETNVGPVIFDMANARSRAVCVAFDPDASSWPFDVSYVVFLASAIDSLGGVTGSASSGTIQPGGTLSVRLPIGARDVTLTLPGQNGIQLEPAPDGRVAYGPIPRAGILKLSWIGSAAPGDTVEDGRAERLIPVNLLDSLESDVRSAPVLPFASGDIAASQQGSSASPRRLWPWFLLAALLICLFEWWVYNRRVYL